VAQRLDHHPLSVAGSGHGAGGSVAQLDKLPADLDRAAVPVGQVDGAGSDLTGQSQGIGGSRTGALKAASRFARQSVGNPVRVCGDQSQRGVKTGVIVEATPKAADQAFFSQS